MKKNNQSPPRELSSLKQTLKRSAPESIWHAARKWRDAFYRAREWPSATFHPLRRGSIHRLRDLKGAHLGERCFIIGNGPSLNQTDLSRLESEVTFGMNRFYLMFPELGFTSTYYVSINSLVIEQCASDIQNLPIPHFLSWRSHKLIAPSANTIFLYTTYTGEKFAFDVRDRLWEGATVTYVALQLAFHMGFQEVILIGVDHSFSTQGQPNTTVVSQGEDQDHFHKDYFGKGFRWQLPDLDTSEQGYQLACQAFQREGRIVLDATINGKLTVFPKVDYDTLF